MTRQRIELLDEAKALIAKTMKHRCTTEEEWGALYDIAIKIDQAISPWEWVEYEREDSARLRRWEMRRGIVYGSPRSAFLTRRKQKRAP
jgi:hypothetical protein